MKENHHVDPAVIVPELVTQKQRIEAELTALSERLGLTSPEIDLTQDLSIALSNWMPMVIMAHGFQERDRVFKVAEMALYRALACLGVAKLAHDGLGNLAAAIDAIHVACERAAEERHRA